jgi:hypothetical protein
LSAEQSLVKRSVYKLHLKGVADVQTFKIIVYGLLLGREILEMPSVGLMKTVLLGPLGDSTAAVYRGTASTSGVVATSGILVLIMACASALALSSAGIEVAIERDW